MSWCCVDGSINPSEVFLNPLNPMPGRIFLLLTGTILFFSTRFSYAQPAPTTPDAALRAPAYPLITIDPYTSAWSCADRLYDDDVRHWTGVRHTLTGVLRVDGKPYRFMGKASPPYQTEEPTAEEDSWRGKYTFTPPAEGWTDPLFDDAAWEVGKAAFGTADMPFMRTPWETKDIWVRREVKLTKAMTKQALYLEYSHDDIFELYFNGVKVVGTGYCWEQHARIPLPEEALKTIGKGPNIIAAHCHNKAGNGYVDFGVVTEISNEYYFDRTAKQTSVSVTPTQTYYQFTCGPVRLALTFTAPLLMDDLMLLSRPVNYVTYEVTSADKRAHEVEIYFDTSADWAVNSADQPVMAYRETTQGLGYFKTGTKAQAVLDRAGDDVRIDWGYFYLAGKRDATTTYAMDDVLALRKSFADKGMVVHNEKSKPQIKDGRAPTGMAYVENLGEIMTNPVKGKLLLGYDDVYAVQYFGDNLQAWWKQNGTYDMMDALQQANEQYDDVMARCKAFDKKLVDDARRAGGAQYADLCALVYREAVAAHKLVRGKDGKPLFFSKENFHNGTIGTVEVSYSAAPLFLLYNPLLVEGMLNPIFYYAAQGGWAKPFAPHDVGTYPVANGQTDAENMPIEACSNMLILTAAMAQSEGNADYAKKHWQTLSAWADYLRVKGADPKNQHSADDFAGNHLARNANLGIKAVLGVASYAKLAGMLGHTSVEYQYFSLAREMASDWRRMAYDDDHFTLAFEQYQTWSQKYNLVWDEILQLLVFPASISRKEVAYYLDHQNKYGLPLDNRVTYTRSDWTIWSACMSSDQETFKKFVTPIYQYVNQTPDRVPLSDWHETTDATVVGFRARPVVGGYFMKILWDKYVR